MTTNFSIKDSIARVTLNRPERLNAVDADTENELEAIWRTIEADASIRCVVLTGAGDKAFCAGADLKSDSGKSGLEYWASSNPNGFGGISYRQSLNVPVIARINGIAMGGGMEMALGCDIIIASDQARFALPEAKVGRLPLDGGMVLLPRLIPQKIAAGLMLSGREMDASMAAHYGLVNSVVAHEALDNEVDAWLADIISCAPLSVSAIKHTIRSTASQSCKEAQFARSDLLVAALTSEDAIEGIAAFREKRPAVWQGQ